MNSLEKLYVDKKKKDLIEKILNHRVQGEGYITTSGRVWKALVLKHFNKIHCGELTLDALVFLLELKEGVIYSENRNLVKYPIQECLIYISKICNRPINTIEKS